MKNVTITVLRQTCYPDLSAQYENPIEHACAMQVGQIFVSENGERPDGLCESAWDSMKSFVLTLACGGKDFYDGWMRDPYSAVISCNDGFRPVSFLLRADAG